MWEVMQSAVAMVNLPFTILMIIVVLYWVVVIVSGLDFHHGAEVDGQIDAGHGPDLAGKDIHIGAKDVHIGAKDVHIGGKDVHVGTGVHIGKDVHVGGKDTHVGGKDVAAGGHASTWESILVFFNVGQVPLTVLISLMAFSLWTLSLMGNHYLNPGLSALVAGPLLVPNFLISLFVTKFISTPLKPLFAALNKDYNAPPEVIGNLCVVSTTTVSDRLGQAVVQTKGAPILLNVVSEGGQVLHKGQEAVVLREDDRRNAYVIAPAEPEK